MGAPRAQCTGKQAGWRALEDHDRAMRGCHLRKLFADDPARSERMTAEAAGVFLPYSKNSIDDEKRLRLLIEPEQSGPRARTEAMFRGETINVTEDRVVLHVALRALREHRASSTAKTSCRRCALRHFRFEPGVCRRFCSAKPRVDAFQRGVAPLKKAQRLRCPKRPLSYSCST